MSASVDLKQCLRLIKQLQSKNEQLTQERDDALQCKNCCNQQLVDLNTQYSKMISKLKVLHFSHTQSSGQCVPIEEDDLENPEATSQKHNLVDVDYLKDLEDLLEEKNREIVTLQKNCKSLSQETIQLSKMKSFLKETKLQSMSYIAQLDKMQNYLDGFGLDCCEETTHPQAVSGDQDVVMSPNTNLNINLQKELHRAKEENRKLLSRLQSLQKLEAEYHSIIAQKTELEKENNRLQTEINIISTAQVSDFPIESQIKVFLDDFQDERKEKEQQYKEKREVFEENQKLASENQLLKDKMEKMSKQVNDLQQQMIDWSPPQNHAPPLPVSYSRGVRTRLRTSEYVPTSPDQMNPLFYNQVRASKNFSNCLPVSVTGYSSAYYETQPPVLTAPLPEQPRKIGFPRQDTPLRPPTSSLRMHNSRFLPQHSVPRLSRQEAQRTRPPFSPVEYVQQSMQPDPTSPEPGSFTDNP